MLKIRLQRRGKRNQPFFRIIVTEKDNPPRGGKALELLGFLNPKTKEKQLKGDRIKHWLSRGAQASDRVHNLLVAEGIIKAKKKPVHAKPKKKEGEEAKPAEEAAAVKKEGKDTPAEEKKEEAKSEEPVPSPSASLSVNSAEVKPKEELKPTEKPAEKKEEEKPAPAEEKKE